jgi:hypothetical protein
MRVNGFGATACVVGFVGYTIAQVIARLARVRATTLSESRSLVLACALHAPSRSGADWVRSAWPWGAISSRIAVEEVAAPVRHVLATVARTIGGGLTACSAGRTFLIA